jgi:hypothetical protein
MREGDMDETPRTTLRRPSRLPWVVLAVVVIGAAVAAWLWMRRTPSEPPASEVATPVPPAVEVPDAGPAAAAPAAPRGPATLESVSEHPLYRRALAADDVVRRWAVVTDNVAEGVSPREQVPFLAPAQKFSAVARGGKRVIAPASYARYDGFGDMVASLDAQAVASVYRAMHGPLEAAYRALGYPQGALDDVTARALGRLAAAPVVEGDVEVEEDGGIFFYKDPKLEEQGDIEKHLLRMGPRNGRLVQAKARELLQVLGVKAKGRAPSP